MMTSQKSKSSYSDKSKTKSEKKVSGKQIWKVWKFKSEEAKKWIKAGINDPREASGWRIHNFSIEEAVEWKNYGFNTPLWASRWRCEGLNPKEARDWINTGLENPEYPIIYDIIVYRNADITPEQIRICVESGWTDEYPPEEVIELIENEIDPTDPDAPRRYWKKQDLSVIETLAPELEEEIENFQIQYEGKIENKNPTKKVLWDMKFKGIKILEMFQQLGYAVGRVKGSEEGIPKEYKDLFRRIDNELFTSKREFLLDMLDDIHDKIYGNLPGYIPSQRMIKKRA